MVTLDDGIALASAYNTTSGTTLTYYFANYISLTYARSVTGSLACSTTAGTYNGTITFSGGTVKSFVYTNVVLSGSQSGTCNVTFTDNTAWTYNYATTAFTKS